MDDLEEDGYRVMGDVFVCPEVAAKYVETQKTDHNIYQELTLYVIHGLLHLIGFDDIDEADRLEMRNEESRYLKHVASKNLCIPNR